MIFKKSRVILISCLLVASFLFSGTTYAQDEDLPDPGITPDSPFYVFDTLGKNIGMFFTFGPEAKTKKALQYAEERLSEAQAMEAKNRLRETTRATNDYNSFMTMVNENVQKAAQRGTSDNASETAAATTARIRDRLDKLKDKLPRELKKDADRVSDNETREDAAREAAAEAIDRALEISLNVQKNALLALAKAKPERAIEINAEAIENRLNRARVKATENVTSEVESALEDAAVLTRIEEEISGLAQQLGDNTTLQKKLAHSTSNRLETLARVYEKAPETAKPAIEKAMENSVSKYERAVATLKEKNALGEIPGESLVSDNISDNVTAKVRVQVEVKERVKEPVSNLKPGKPEPAVSANKTNSGKTPERKP